MKKKVQYIWSLENVSHLIGYFSLCYFPMVLNRRSRIVLEFWCIVSWGYYTCEHYAITSPGAWSWSLTQDLSRWNLMLIVKPYVRLAIFEVSLQARDLSRNWIAATKLFPVASSPAMVVISSNNTCQSNPFSTSCWESDILCFYNILGFLLKHVPYS